MAVISYSVSTPASGVIVVKWETVTENDTCQPYLMPPGYKDKTFMATGTWGGGSIGLRGSINPDETTVANFEPLDDHTGTVIGPTADDILVIAQNCLRYAPGTPTGTGVDLDVWMMGAA